MINGVSNSVFPAGSSSAQAAPGQQGHTSQKVPSRLGSGIQGSSIQYNKDNLPSMPAFTAATAYQSSTQDTQSSSHLPNNQPISTGQLSTKQQHLASMEGPLHLDNGQGIPRQLLVSNRLSILGAQQNGMVQGKLYDHNQMQQQYQQLEQKLLEKHNMEKFQQQSSYKNAKLYGNLNGQPQGYLAQANINNVGTNYQLPQSTFGSDQSTGANSTQIMFQTPQVRPGSRKLAGLNHQAQTQTKQPGIIQELHQFKKGKPLKGAANPSGLGGSAIKPVQLSNQGSLNGGTLSSKNLIMVQPAGKSSDVYQTQESQQIPSQAQFQSRKHFPRNYPSSIQPIGTEGLQVIKQQSTLDNEQQFYKSPSPFHQKNAGSNITPMGQPLDADQNTLNNAHGNGEEGENHPLEASRNRESRGSKRSVVFSKNSQAQPGQHDKARVLQTGNGTPSTPKIHVKGGATSQQPPQQRMSSENTIMSSQQINNQPASLLSAGSIKIRVNAPSSVKTNKNNLKNLVLQKQQQQFPSDPSEDQQLYYQVQQYQPSGAAALNPNSSSQQAIPPAMYTNSKALINSKRRSNAVDHRENQLVSQGTQKAISSSSALKNHPRVPKKQSTNIISGEGLQNHQQSLMNKTMSNISSANGNLSNSGKAQTNMQNHLKNSLVVVRLNQIQPSSIYQTEQSASQGEMGVPIEIVMNQGQKSSGKPQISLSMLSPEQQQQILQQHFLQQQQQQQKAQQVPLKKGQTLNGVMLNHQSSGSQMGQQLSSTQLGPAGNQNSHRQGRANSINQKSMHKYGSGNRPQSQNNNVVIQGVSSGMAYSQHSGSNDGGTISASPSRIQSQISAHQQNHPNHQLFLSSQNNSANSASISSQIIQQQKLLALQQQQTQLVMSTSQAQAAAQLQNPQKLVSSKHLQIQQIRLVNNSQAEIYAAQTANSENNEGSQRQLSQPPQNPQPFLNQIQQLKTTGSPGSSKYFIKNQLRHISKMIEDDEGYQAGEGEALDTQDQPAQNPQYQNSNNQGVHLRDGGMTLEDDVESMLSEQFNTSNESMFRVRGVTGAATAAVITQGGGGGGVGAAGGGGDSTFRCNDSMYDEDRGLISESEDGWYAEKEKEGGYDNKIDDISEHSSDDVSDSEPEAEGQGEMQPKKVKKPKGEKGEKKKKKKKKLEAQEGEGSGAAQIQISSDPKKIAQNYKKMEEQSKKGAKTEQVKVQSKQVGDSKTTKRKGHEVNPQQIKVNIQTKKSENKTVNDSSNVKNAFSSPVVKSTKAEKLQSTSTKANTATKNLPKTDKKEESKNQSENPTFQKRH